MRRHKSILSGILLMVFLSLATTLFAAEIRILNNRTVTVTDATLSANCSDTFIESGSSLIFNSGLFQDMGHRSGDGALTLNNSSIEKCYKSFYVIPRPDGASTIICL